MSQIAKCPACDEQLSVPLIAEGSSRLQCPSCNSEFTLEETSMLALPEAILLDAGEVESDVAEKERFDFEDGVVARTAEIEDDVTAGDPDADFPEAAPWDFGEPADERQQVAIGPGTRDAEMMEASMAVRATARRRPRKSFLRQLVGIVGGGIVGLALGYYLLLWIGGPDRDFLKLGKRLPAWAVSAEFQTSEITEMLPDHPKLSLPLSSRYQSEISDSLNEFGATPSEVPEDAEPPGAAISTDSAPPPGETKTATTDPSVDVSDTAIPKSPVVLGLRETEPVTPDGLAMAIKAAVVAKTGLIEGGLSDPSVRPKKETSYTTFCKLAEALTLAYHHQAAGMESTPAQQAALQLHRNAARDLFTKTMSGAKILGEVGAIGRAWLNNPKRHNQGIVLIGHVLGPYECSPYEGLLLKCEGAAQTVPVISSQTLPHSKDDRIVAVGTIVDDPVKQMLGFTETPPRIIYTATTFRAE